MYEELVKAINPKPIFNLTWYRNEDLYSEGDIEDLIIKIIAENNPEQYVQAIAKNYNWSTYYHLTHIRRNILNWYPFKEDASVLEIGCGMGAITNMLCEKCKEVTAVELSKRRATATLLRCCDKDNLEIIVGNLNDINFDKRFDYITLIGVLEYQGNYTDTDNPYADFLKKVRSLLKPDGILLVAIENQYGLKYWCGACEDHTGIPFDGINQYSVSDGKVRTFSRSGLESLIKEGGFEKTFFYYPLPDYKLPTTIYSQDCLPKENLTQTDINYYYIPNNSTLVAQEKNIYKDIIDNNVFEFFANSFLVECTVSGNVGEVTYAKLSTGRFKEYQVGTNFTRHGKAEKFAISNTYGLQHINQILKNERMLTDRGLNVWPYTLHNNRLISDFTDAPTLNDMVTSMFRNRDTDGIYRVFDLLYSEILNSSEEADWNENIIYMLGLAAAPDKEKYGPILKTGYLDMILINAFWYNDKPHWFDQEWTLENVPAKFVMYRAINQFYGYFKEAKSVIPITVLADRYNLLNIWKDCQTLDSLFSESIADMLHIEETGRFSGVDRDICIRNIQRLLK